MKTKKILIGALLCLGMASQAQLLFPASLNTGYAGSGQIPVGLDDTYWKSSSSSINGPYKKAVRVATVSGWKTVYPADMTMPANAAWISYPHNCSGSGGVQSVSFCRGVDHEEYYKIDFTLGNGTGSYALNWFARADNCVYAMYLNTTTPGNQFYLSPPTAYYTGHDHSATGPKFGTLITGFHPGLNTLYVHVKSGIDTASLPSASHTGFLFYGTLTYDGQPGTDDPGTGGDCCLGNVCGNAQNALAGNYEIPMNNFNFNFSGDNEQVTDKVNVGYDCNDKGPGKLNSVTTFKTADVKNDPTAKESISIYGLNKYYGAGTGVGVMGEAINPSENASAVGVWGNGRGGNNNTGGNFFAYDGQKHNIGVSGIAIPGNVPAPYNYKASYNSTHIGVYGAGDPKNSNEEGVPGSHWAAWFDGDVNVVGTLYSTNTGVWSGSDKRFKKDIHPLSDVTEKLKKLTAYTYKFKTDEFKDKDFSKEEQIGVIAQELKEVYPQLVSERGGYNYVNYSGLVPVLLEGFKEQQKQIDEQKQLIAELTQKVSGLTGINQANAINTGFQMAQNEPNPFTYETVVKYTLPQTVSNAFMAVYDLTGKQITTFPIREKGSSAITITSEKLPAGIYIYSIVADGKITDSKRMIVAGK